MSLLSIKNITKTYITPNETITVLKNNSLELEAGKIHTLLGNSGCGKTTLLMLCGGLINPDSGSIIINNINLSELSASERALQRASLIGFVFQRFHLIPYLSVEQNILLPCIAKPHKNHLKQAAMLMEKLGIIDRRFHLPAKLSAGEQQRVALGRAMFNNPLLLIADEPTGNLDKNNAEHILTMFKNFANDGGTVLIATHDERVAAIADHRYKYNNAVFVS